MRTAARGIGAVGGTAFAMLPFAGNSLLTRLALTTTGIDAATFTSVRLASGALVLWLVVRMRKEAPVTRGNWVSAFALFVYAITVTLAYRTVPNAVGALLLFGATQVTMVTYGILRGERMGARRAAGMAAALCGFVGLLLPGLAAPPFFASTLMLSSGLAWGIYSLRGRQITDATAVTADNFLRTLPFAIMVNALALRSVSLDAAGIGYAIASGAITSGIGYAVWYAALKRLQATEAATVQLSVPVLAAIGGAVFIGESPTLRSLLASLLIIGGIALVSRPGAVMARMRPGGPS